MSSTVPFCPPGSTYNPAAGGCIPDRYENPSSPAAPTPVGSPDDPTTGVGTLPNCPPGQRWDAVNRTCVAEVTGKPAQPPVETPLGVGDCPPGMHWNNNARECRPGATKAAPAPAPPGGGAPAGPPPPPAPKAPGDGIEDDILARLREMLAGHDVPFTDDVVSRMRSQAFATSRGRLPAENDAIYRDAARRGMLRGGETGERVDAARRAAGDQYGAASNEILTKQVVVNFQARLDALDRAQKWLDSQRSYLLGKESNAIQREIGLAQIKLGYSKIEAEKEMLLLQLDRMGGGGGGGGGEDPLLGFIDILNRYGSGR